jgi:sialic acid synthase SpsE
MKTFIIAEAGINHEGNFEKAKALVDAAKESEADAVKFQTYQTSLRVGKDNQFFGLLKSCELSYDEHLKLKQYADEVGIEYFSTPFDEISLKFLLDMGVRRIKFASFDVSNKKLLKAANDLATQYLSMEVILSVGMSSVDEIMAAIDILKDVKLVLLHCVSSYPTPPNKANLLEIHSIRNLTGGHYPVGYSDHTPDIIIPSASVLMGAAVVEKHFTLDKTDSAVDNPVSADPSMFKKMVGLIRLYESSLGDGSVGLKEVEKFFTIFKRTS